ncbi:Ribonuclease H-like superfamily [Sesbania bispinosa]|nr:Ribonuclease H-like superfamily [Sesbania bispinosa]
MDLSVQAYADSNGCWDFSSFQHLIPPTVMQEIRGGLPPQASLQADKVIWAFNNNGNFSTKDWINQNISSPLLNSNGDPWHITFAIAIWSLWQARNDFLFSSTHNLLMDMPLFHRIHVKALEIFSTLYSDRGSSSPNRNPRQVLINWKCPPNDYVKCNVDASVRPPTGEATCGGVFRNDHGTCIMGFVRNVGVATINIAELWGIYSALTLVGQLNIANIWIELDSLCVVSLINKDGPHTHPCYAIVQAIRNYINLHPNTRVTHCF